MADGGLPAVVRDQVVDKVGGKVIDKAKSALQAKKLKNQLTAESVADHAFEGHAAELGAETVGDAQNAIEGALNSNSVTRRSSPDGRSLTADHDSGIVVVRNPNVDSGGTAFKPPDLDKYLDDTNIRNPGK